MYMQHLLGCRALHLPVVSDRLGRGWLFSLAQNRFQLCLVMTVQDFLKHGSPV